MLQALAAEEVQAPARLFRHPEPLPHLLIVPLPTFQVHHQYLSHMPNLIINNGPSVRATCTKTVSITLALMSQMSLRTPLRIQFLTFLSLWSDLHFLIRKKTRKLGILHCVV
jgi:hypothetical protein